MKTIILIKDNRTQLVLQAETDHEKEVLDLLEKLPNTHRCEFYDTQGGFTRGYSSFTEPYGYTRSRDKDLLIVFDKDTNVPTKELK